MRPRPTAPPPVPGLDTPLVAFNTNCRVIYILSMVKKLSILFIWSSQQMFTLQTWFSGVQRRQRTCVGGTAGQLGCIGDPAESRNCNAGTGSWNPWGAYSACSVGLRVKITATSTFRTTYVTIVFKYLYKSMCIGNYSILLAQASCGGGIATRQRSHTCLEAEQETIACNTFGGEVCP